MPRAAQREASFFFRSIYPCKINAALTLSTCILSLLSIFFSPPSIIALCASTEVNLSSSSSTGFSGNAFFNCFRKISTSAAASEGVLSIFIGYPTTNLSTGFAWA